MSVEAGDRAASGLSDAELASTSGPPAVRIAAALGPNYVVERELGRGGSAIVFLALHVPTQSRIAVKLLRSELARAVGEARFRREIKIARDLDHPNILQLFDVGSTQGDLYFTMPFVEGETVRGWLTRVTQVDIRTALVIARQVANALDYAHSRNVVHRDVKPANILLGTKGAMVADFGIARLMTTDTGDTLTDSGIAIGTPEYMSPEQGTGGRADARSDIYSLGCVVYEMLAGEPPFTGPTSQAIIARHCQEPPRSIRIIRPAVPLGVQQAVERALAKVPADRFESAGAFVDALEAGYDQKTDVFGALRLSLRARKGIATALASVVLLGVATVPFFRRSALDPNRVVVFPLHATGADTDIGEEIATFIGYRLAEARPLHWKDGWELLDAEQRSKPARLDPEDLRKLSRRDGAAFYIDGSVMRRGDSLTIALRLVNVEADSVVRSDVRSTHVAAASVHQLALNAVQVLLLDLVAPGGRIDPTQLAARNAASVAHFLQGERDYRRMRFRTALPHYQAALNLDSAFALAAMRGAYAASWLSEPSIARPLVRVALGRRSQLTPAQVLVTRGLDAYLRGDADAAVTHLRRALRADSTVHGAWTLLGEVYSRLLPNEWAADSLARHALERARLADADFAPTLLLLEEFALRDGDARRAARFARELEVAGADTTHALARRLMHACVRDGVRAVDWGTSSPAQDGALITAGKVLGGGAAQPDCAIESFLQLLSSSSATLGARWNAFIALQAQLAAVGRSGETVALLASRGIRTDQLRAPKLIAAVAGAGFQSEARRYADSLSLDYSHAPSISLWLVGQLEANTGQTGRLENIAAILRQRADSALTPLETRLARSIQARLLANRGDTSDAIAVLESLKPGSERREIIWYLWESLAMERMQLARLQFARKQFEDARRTASLLDATEPLTYPFFRRESLELRAAAADSLRQPDLAVRYRARLRRPLRS